MSQFLSHTAVSPQGDSRWQAEVHRGWRIGSVANGGYVLALVGRALSEALNQPDPLSINAFYLAPVALGEVEVAVESLSETRSTHFASAGLLQEGQLKLRATAAAGKRTSSSDAERNASPWCQSGQSKQRCCGHRLRRISHASASYSSCAG